MYITSVVIKVFSIDVDDPTTGLYDHLEVHLYHPVTPPLPSLPSPCPSPICLDYDQSFDGCYTNQTLKKKFSECADIVLMN